jgi:hypothetical protein
MLEFIIMFLMFISIASTIMGVWELTKKRWWSAAVSILLALSVLSLLYVVPELNGSIQDMPWKETVR